MNEKHEPMINLMEWLIDPVGDKAEIELRDSKKTKRSNKSENPLKEIAFIVDYLQEKSVKWKQQHHQ